MSSITLKADSATIQTMQEYYQERHSLMDPVPYSVFRAKVQGVTITAYQSGKVLFQGKEAQVQADYWKKQGQVTSLSKKEKTGSRKHQTSSGDLPQGFDQWTIMGSDEVGNGSYFGALTVCAVYLDQEQQELLRTLGVKDSKALSDRQIRDLAWQIKECLPYQLIVCNPIDYNRGIQNHNAVSMKVALHNHAVNKLVRQLSPDQMDKLQGTLIDQFTPESSYRTYLKKETVPYQDRLYFVKKGESHHLAVAAASIIARDAFLTSLEDLGQPYQVTLPSGAGQAVDQFGVRLVKKFGPDCLKKNAKLHFKNTQKILDQVNH